jgi:hypothetical protein
MKSPNEARALRPLPAFIFASRWLQLPLYLGLIVAQGIYVWLFWQELYYLVLAAFGNIGALGHVLDADPHHLPALRDCDRRQRPHHAGGSREARRARMTVIKRTDLIQSVADALQFISYYHPADYIRALGRAYEREQSAAAKDAIAQILTNSRMCAEGHRPICQDTGIVNVFLKIGMNVRFDFDTALEDVVNEGVRRAYLDPDN